MERRKRRKTRSLIIYPIIHNYLSKALYYKKYINKLIQTLLFKVYFMFRRKF